MEIHKIDCNQLIIQKLILFNLMASNNRWTPFDTQKQNKRIYFLFYVQYIVVNPLQCYNVNRYVYTIFRCSCSILICFFFPSSIL